MPLGVYDHKRKTLAERFWTKVQKTDTCWFWTGVTRNGYGAIGSGGKRGPILYAHRVAYEWAKGLVPDGLVIDHLCRNTRCVNPDHLEAVSNRENCLRGEAPNVQLHRQDRCKNGHDLTIDGYVRKNGGRVCKACSRERRRTTYSRCSQCHHKVCICAVAQ